MDQDAQHLQLLSIFHYVFGGLTALFSLFGLLYLAAGLAMVYLPGQVAAKGPPPPAFMGWIFVAIGGLFVVVGWFVSASLIAAGRCLAKRKGYRFCLVVAGIACTMMPIGTVLGVFTILVLLRPTVRTLFGIDPAPVPAPAR